MSTQSTPRSKRSASVDASPAHMLTPGQKIKAMLAQFDSDSEPENTMATSKTHRIAAPNFTTSVSEKIASALDEDEDDEDEDVTVLAPRGRMAARMQGFEDTETAGSSKPTLQSETAYERVAKTLYLPSANATTNNAQSANEDHSSEDDMPNAAPTRRRLLNAKEHELNTSTSNNVSSNRRSARSESPLFVEEDSEAEPRAESNTSAKEPKDARFLALVERKRKERKEREKVEVEKKAARAEKMKEFNSDVVADDESDEDSESAKKLTQTTRPARKASKKALEEMARETQRLSRNRQLAYQPRVKRKITIDSFVALMNSHKIEQPSEPMDSASSSSAPSSDADANKQKESPPTSPAGPSFDEQKPVQVQPSKSPQTTTTKAPKVSNESRVRVRLSREQVAKRQNEEPDDDLEIITSPSKCRKAAIFENLRSKNLSENQTMLKLKLLARLTSPTSRTKSMSPAELSAMLQLKARQQALRERQERIEELRAQGIVIETAEEREAMEADVEDLMEKAREEADFIARREKAAHEKKSGISSTVSDEEEEDDDYELSGSEDEEEGGMEEDVESDGQGGGSEEELEEGLEVETDHPVQGLVHNEADEASESDEEAEQSSHEAEESLPRGTRGRRQRRVISDDEEEDEANEVQSTKAVQEPKTPARSVAASVGSAQRPQFPNMPGTSTFTMSLTQAFAGTIAEDQSDGEEDSFKVLQSLPDPGLPNLQQLAVDSQVMVKDSQDQRRGSIDLFAGYTQSSSRVPESPGGNWSQFSQMPEPTQDIGFVYSPIDVSKRFVDLPVSTIDTVILPESESPVMRRKGRLLQRGRPVHLSDDEAGDFEIKASAFDVMKKASKQRAKTATAFDKSNSKAKEHVDEAAEESEDEYAGLGGASDDDNGEEDELDREMINDNSGEVVDEKELAALNANHQRTMDEKQVSKLLKDITTGALRRRRGADDDLALDDSDDERLARRRAKQREFAKMRKALLADEKVNEIASNPKKQAFFKALEDRDDDDEMEFEFDNNGNSEEASFSVNEKEEQSAGADAEAGGESEKASHKRKRPLEPAAEDASNRPPPYLRRTAANVSRKPSSLAEIRETLSFLTATPEYDSFHEDASIEEDIVYSTDKGNSENDSENNTEPSRKSSTDGFAIPPNPRRTRGPVVDRLALRRASSSNSARAGAKPAFVTGTSSWDTANVGFRPPPLLRRATSSWSTSDSSSSFSTSGAKKSSSGPKAGLSNSNKGSVNYYTAARERERERDLRLKERGGSKITAAKIAQLQKKSLENGLLAWTKKGSGFEV